jgi:hypothetical protein
MVIYLSDDCNCSKALQIITHNQQIIYDLLVRIDRKVTQEMPLLEALTAEVQNNTTVDNGAIVLLNGLSAKLAEIAGDPAAVQALADELSSSSAALSAAVVANTPAAEAPPVEPTV